jgi:hypothetical protein
MQINRHLTNTNTPLRPDCYRDYGGQSMGIFTNDYCVISIIYNVVTQMNVQEGKTVRVRH